MRILVTGATGFVGPHLVRRLLAAGHAVTGTFWEVRVSLPGAELVEADLGDRQTLAALVDRTRPEVIVHLAGLSHVGGSWDRMADYYRVNVLGTQNVVELAPASARVLVASSAEVYGLVPEDEQPIAEERQVAPASPYAMTKAMAELVALTTRPEGVVVVRSFNIVGPGQARRFALPSFAAQLAAIHRGEAEPVLRVGNLAARRDFVHVQDAVRALELVASTGEPGATYNLASGRAHSIAEALDRLIEVSGTQPRIEQDPARLRPVDQPLLVGDASKLRALGWTEERGFERAIRDLWEETLAQGGGTAP